MPGVLLPGVLEILKPKFWLKRTCKSYYWLNVRFLGIRTSHIAYLSQNVDLSISEYSNPGAFRLMEQFYQLFMSLPLDCHLKKFEPYVYMTYTFTVQSTADKT